MMKLLSSLLGPLFRGLGRLISGGFKWLLEGIQGFFKAPLSNIWKALKSLVTGSVFVSSWLVLFEEFVKKILGWLGLIAGVSSGALGAKQIFRGEEKMIGTIADITSFSFHAVKNFTTAEGGAAVWNLPQSVYDSGVTDAEIYKFYQLLSLHGQNKDALSKTKAGAWEYDIIGAWYKCNMTDIMAAIGLKQLDRYPELLERRIQIIAKYDNICDSLGISHLVHHTDFMDSSNHLYLIRIPDISEEKRNKFITKMAEYGVATNVHYKPLPMMTAYGKDCSDYPVSYDYYKNLVSLPLHTRLTDEDADYVCEILKTVYSELK